MNLVDTVLEGAGAVLVLGECPAVLVEVDLRLLFQGRSLGGKAGGFVRVDLADSCREPGVVCAHEICCVHTGVLAFEVGEGEVEVHLPPKVRKPPLMDCTQLISHTEYLERVIGIGFEMIEDNL